MSALPISPSGADTDSDLTVTFYNGKTEKVTTGKAVWIPLALHDRITLELKMPKEARRDLEKHEGYPEKSYSGYPTNGNSTLSTDFTSDARLDLPHKKTMISIFIRTQS